MSEIFKTCLLLRPKCLSVTRSHNQIFNLIEKNTQSVYEKSRLVYVLIKTNKITSFMFLNSLVKHPEKKTFKSGLKV